MNTWPCVILACVCRIGPQSRNSAGPSSAQYVPLSPGIMPQSNYSNEGCGNTGGTRPAEYDQKGGGNEGGGMVSAGVSERGDGSEGDDEYGSPERPDEFFDARSAGGSSFSSRTSYMSRTAGGGALSPDYSRPQ